MKITLRTIDACSPVWTVSPNCLVQQLEAEASSVLLRSGCECWLEALRAGVVGHPTRLRKLMLQRKGESDQL